MKKFTDTFGLVLFPFLVLIYFIIAMIHAAIMQEEIAIYMVGSWVMSNHIVSLLQREFVKNEIKCEIEKLSTKIDTFNNQGE